MQITITNATGTWDVTGMVSTIRWSGGYNQAARTLELSLASSPSDSGVPAVDTPLGAVVQMIENAETLFDGFVVTRTKNTEGSLLQLTCFDRGFYLKRNRTIKKYTARQPEDIVRELAGEFGIQVGDLAATGVQVSRTFITATSLYDIMATVYTLASQSNGRKYHIGFRGPRLYVTEKAPDNRTLVLQGKSNLIAANVTESITGMVNMVAIYDKDGNYLRSVENSEWIQLYGRMQEALKQSDSDDKSTEAARLLEDGGPSQKITVDALGNVANVAGGTVVVRESYTGLYGLFYIDSDIHEWKRGQYYNKLVLNFKNMMDEKELGSLPNADGSKTAAAAATGTAQASTPERQYYWKYDYHGNER